MVLGRLSKRFWRLAVGICIFSHSSSQRWWGWELFHSDLGKLGVYWVWFLPSGSAMLEQVWGTSAPVKGILNATVYKDNCVFHLLWQQGPHLGVMLTCPHIFAHVVVLVSVAIHIQILTLTMYGNCTNPTWSCRKIAEVNIKKQTEPFCTVFC